ncbi:MAG: hypothetical protein ACOYVF_13940 [Candidatus Zixiibacteriota bacterium]
MSISKIPWYVFIVLALITCVSSVDARRKGNKSDKEKIELRHPTVSLGLGLEVAYLTGDAVTAKLG